MPEQYDLLIETMPLPIAALVVLTAFQLTVMSFLSAFLGIKLARKTGFSLSILDAVFTREKIRFNAKAVWLSILLGTITGLVITGGDRFYFRYSIEAIGDAQLSFSLVGLLVGVLYGGVFEEILLRLFIMSLLVWLFKLLFQRNRQSLPPLFYWLSIIIAAALFAAGHLPATNMLFGGLTTEIIIKCFLLNGVGGLFFGFLYWKKGFEYAVIAHMFTHISMQLLFIPLFY